MVKPRKLPPPRVAPPRRLIERIVAVPAPAKGTPERVPGTVLVVFELEGVRR